MRNVGAILILLAIGRALAVPTDVDGQARKDAEKVSRYIKHEPSDIFEDGPLQNGTAVYNADRDLAFWVDGKTIYTVNERARQAAPALPQAPENITYDAVYDASYYWSELSREVRPSEIAMQGYKMSPEEVEKLEEVVRARPDDLWARTVLLGYYQTRQFRQEENRKKREGHILWLVEHAPESAVVASSDAHLDPFSNQEAYGRAAKLMKDHVTNNPQNVRLLANAAKYFSYTDPSYASECLRKCTQLEPNNLQWHKKLADSLHRQDAFRATGISTNPNGAKEALAEQERALQLATDPMERMDLIGRLADTAFDAGDMEKARAYANHLLENVETVNKWARGNFTHTANIVLGRIALKEGDVAGAKKFLLASATFDQPPQLGPLGPRMELAIELMDKGEREVVIEYFEVFGKVWNKKIADVWIDGAKIGRKPRTDTALAIMMQDPTAFDDVMTQGPGPVDWEEPLLTLPLGSDPIQILDTVYGLPLLALVGLVLLIRLFSSRQHLWILAPLLFIYTVPLGVFWIVPEFTVRLFGLDGYAMQHLLSTYFGSLAVLWMLSDLLARMKWWGRVPAAVVVLGAAGFLGTINYTYRYHIISEISAFVIVVVASFAVAGLCCSKRYAWWKFLAFLFTFNLVFMLIVWPLLWVARMSITFGETWPEMAPYFRQHLLIALVDGLGLFVLLLPFFLVASLVPLYKEQFRRILNLPQQ